MSDDARREVRGARRDTGARRDAGARLDEAIDRAVREMLDVEPPAGLRARVLDRIDGGGSVASAFRRKMAWIAVPVAAAAIVVLAVLAPWREETNTARPFKSSGDHRLAVESSPPPPAIVAPRRAPPVQVAAGRPAMPRRGFVEAAAAGTDTNFTSVEPLPGPAPIAVEQLPGLPAPAIHTVSVAPIEIRALRINPITETPRERRQE